MNESNEGAEIFLHPGRWLVEVSPNGGHRIWNAAFLPWRGVVDEMFDALNAEKDAEIAAQANE